MLAVLLSGLLLPLAACSDDEPEPSGYDAADQVGPALERMLRRRARAVLAEDSTQFLRSVAVRDSGFVEQQTTYFTNLTQLPISLLRYRVDRDSLEAAGDDGSYWAEVEVDLRLEGYDAAPVRTRDRYLFAATRAGRYRLASTTDDSWEKTHLTGAQPWDLGPIEVRETVGVLGVFDEVTIEQSTTVLDAVGDARYDVADTVPAEEPASVVVYAVSDTAFLDGLAALPVSDPSRLDALTFPVPVDAATPGGPAASYRMLLTPGVLSEPGDALDRLARHELTHVTLGEQGRGGPLWLSEGVAEYVSVRPIPAAERRLAVAAMSLVAGGIDGLPSDEVFAGADAEAWYAVSWWICEYVAAEYGEAMLWDLLDDLAGDADPAVVLPQVLGITPEELATRGADLMVSTYGR